jgi:hypothetical protein
MQRLARFTLIFAILFAVFIVSPAFLSKQFALYPLMKNGDVFDLLTPLVLIPIYWSLFQISRDSKPSQNETIVFLILAALWVEGQGMHLAGNSIGHLTKDIAGSDVETLTHFYDEVLSHYLWHVGLVGLSALLIYRQWKNPFVNERSGLGFAIAAGIIHGFNYFISIVEAATAPLGVPFALLVVIFALVWGRGKLRQQPILAFFFVTYLVATLFFLGWGLYWGGLPEFSKVGIID